MNTLMSSIINGNNGEYIYRIIRSWKIIITICLKSKLQGIDVTHVTEILDRGFFTGINKIKAKLGPVSDQVNQG